MMQNRSPAICEVIERRMVTADCCRLIINAPEIAGTALPGQFVMIYMNDKTRHMLPRPFSIYSADREKGELVILFQVKGCGTKLLAASEIGQVWRLLGPLGTAFPKLAPHSLLVAGGMGIAPLAFLSLSTDTPCTLIYGTRTAKQLACSPAEFERTDLKLILSTDDGSRGEKGTVVDLFRHLLPAATFIYACGPVPMLAAVTSLSNQAGKKAWISLEEHMGCGIGACLGCVVNTVNGYRRVCRDGPVFSAEEVLFDQYA